MTPMHTCVKWLLGVSGSYAAYIALALQNLREWGTAIGAVLAAAVSLAMLISLSLDIARKLRDRRGSSHDRP